MGHASLEFLPGGKIVRLTTTRSKTTSPSTSGSRKEVRKAFLSGERPAFGTTLFLLMSDHFGDLEWMDWEPDVLGQEIEDDFGVKMPPDVRDKLWAVVSTLTTDRFYRDPLFFNHVCNALSDEPLSMMVWEPAELDEIAWALIEIGMIDLDQGEDFEFSPEVVAYIAELLRKQGVKPFGPFDFIDDLSIPFPMADDPDMVAQRQLEVEAFQGALLADLEQGVQDLHAQIDELKIRPAG